MHLNQSTLCSLVSHTSFSTLQSLPMLVFSVFHVHVHSSAVHERGVDSGGTPEDQGHVPELQGLGLRRPVPEQRGSPRRGLPDGGQALRTLGNQGNALNAPPPLIPTLVGKRRG